MIFDILFLILVEALGGLVSGSLDAIELHERLVQAISDLLELLLLGHHFICKHSQCYFEERSSTLRYLPVDVEWFERI